MTMRKGGKHRWRYSPGKWVEVKTGPGRWKFGYNVNKSQRPHRGVGLGSRYTWRIKAVQKAVKTRSGRYKTVMHGTKRLLKARVKRRG